MVFIIILLLGLLAALFLPLWWTIVPIAFITAFILARRSKRVFWAGFSANALIWLALSLLKSIPNEYLLAQRMTGVFHLNNLILLFIFTVLIAGLLGGISASAGFLARQATLEKKLV